MVKNRLSAIIPFLALFVLVGIGAVKETRSAGRTEFDNAVISSGATDVTEINPFDGKGLVYGLVFSTPTTNGAYVVLRDTDTAVGFASASNVSEVVGIFNFISTTALDINALQNVLMFPHPIRIYRGLSVDASSCRAVGGTAPWCYSVIFQTVDE